MRRAFRTGLFVGYAGIVAVTFLACDSFDSADGPAGGPSSDAANEVTTDATTGDTDAADDARDAGSDGNPFGDATVLFDSDFEGTSSMCPGWNVLSGSDEPTPLARTGARGCLVCAAYPGAAVNIRKIASFTPGEGAGRYVLHFFSRRPPDDAGDGGPRAAPGITASLTVEMPNVAGPSASLPLQDLNPTYEAHSLTLDFDGGGPWTGIQAYLGGSGTPGECFLVDDVVLTRE